MSEFLIFWWKCFRDGFEVLDHTLFGVEVIALCGFAFITYRQYRTEPENRKVKKWERNLKLMSVWAVLLFPIYVLVYAPYAQFRESERSNPKRTIAVAALETVNFCNDYATKWEEGIAANIKTHGANPRQYDEDHWSQFVSECGPRIKNTKTELLGVTDQYQDTLANLVPNDGPLVGRTRTPADIRDITSAIERLAKEIGKRHPQARNP